MNRRLTGALLAGFGIGIFIESTLHVRAAPWATVLYVGVCALVYFWPTTKAQ
jgi:hypothetical protein